MMRSILIVTVSVALGSPACFGQGEGQPQPPQRRQDNRLAYELTVRPAAEPTPALRYVFQHEVVDLTPGNAAIAYQKLAAGFFSNDQFKTDLKKAHQWLKENAADLPVDEAQNLLKRYDTGLHQLERATRYKSCDWQTNFLEEGVNTIMPGLGVWRGIGMMVALKVRLAVARQNFDEAARWLRIGFTLARHVGNSDTLIEALVGISISSLMLKEVHVMMEAPGSPNLYWALTDLPLPLIDMRSVMRMEASALIAAYPELRDLESAPMTLQEARQLLDRINEQQAGRRLPRFNTGMAVAQYPIAKKELVAQGHDAELIEAMPVVQVVLLHKLGEYRFVRDQMLRWSNVPYWQARAGMERAEADMKKAQTKSIEASLLMLTLPAMSAARRNTVQQAQHVAALRSVEAVRMYAAAHEGKTPTSLDQINNVPIPIDPVTGKPFEYRVEGANVTVAGEPATKSRPHAYRYTVTIEKDQP